MEQAQDQASTRRAAAGRLAAVLLAAGVTSASTLAVGLAGAASRSTRLSVVKTSTSGRVLADGNTVYTLAPSSTACTTACLKVWPAVVLPKGVKHASAGPGVVASKLGAVSVHGVGRQVTYGGKRLYRFSGDTAPGQVNGNITDTWGRWSAVVISKAAGSSSKSGSGNSTAGTGGVSF